MCQDHLMAANRIIGRLLYTTDDYGNSVEVGLDNALYFWYPAVFYRHLSLKQLVYAVFYGYNPNTLY